MALQYRKKVRDKVLALLTASFNSTLASLLPTYGIQNAFTIDFSNASTSFAVSHVDPANIEKSQLLDFPAGCLYTTAAEDMGEARGLPFDGTLHVNLDFYVRAHDGAESFDSESLADAIEDAVLSIMNDPSVKWQTPGDPCGFWPARKTTMNRQSLVPLGDGYALCIPISALFRVKVTQ